MRIKRDTPNSEIAYYLGIAEENLNHTRDAETSYEIAYRQADLRSPAAIKLGELTAREGKLQDAASYLMVAVADEPANLRAQEELEAVVRALGENSEADRLANLGLLADPANDFLKEDRGKPDLQHLAADPYRVLRVAAEYMRLGLYRNALDVLDRAYSSVPADQSEPELGFAAKSSISSLLLRLLQTETRLRCAAELASGGAVSQSHFSIVRDRQGCFASRTCGE